MPVDIAFGTVKLEYEDVSIPGKVPLVWDRHYSTALLEKPLTPLGHGWTNRYYAALTQGTREFVFVTPEGAVETFADLDDTVARGGVVRNLGAFLEVFRLDERYVVQSWNVDTGEVRRYSFRAGLPGLAWKLSSIEDVTGQAVDVIWDSNGRLSSVLQRLEKRALVIGYNKRGLIERVALEAGNGERHLVMQYEYDAQQRQVVARDAAEFGDRFEYDATGRLTREIVKDGGVFHYRYDPRGRCVKRTGLDHYNEKRLRYIDGIRLTEVIDSYDRKFSYQYLPSGQTICEIDPLGARRTTAYDEHGRIVGKTDATGGTTRYRYDAAGNRASVTDPVGHATSYSYNDHHLPLSMRDAAGQLWRRAYDQHNRLVGTIDPLKNRWLFDYDAEGNVTEVISPLGARKFQRYEYGVLQSLTDWMGNITHYEFDAFGRVVERRGPLGEVARFRYDHIGNLVQAILADGTKLSATYDCAGNLIEFTNATGHSTRWRYGPCKRVLERVNPTGGAVRYVWGSERGWLDKVISENGEIHQFFRDAVGRIVREQSFDGAIRASEYNAEGRVIRYTNANDETIVIERDALQRVTRQFLPDGEQVNFVYDPVGCLTQASNGDIAVGFDRDPLGRIVREVQGDQWVNSCYDAAGNLTRTETSLGHIVDYVVDANGFVVKLTTCGDKTIRFKRNAHGEETARILPGGGAYMEQRFDAAGRLIEQRVQAAGQLPSALNSVVPQASERVWRSYEYDPNGALKKVVDGRRGHVNYVYDPAERLLGTLRDRGSNETFEYDPASNVIRMQAEGPAFSNEVLIYGPGNRLLRKGNTHYEYDTEGRRVKKIEDADTDAPRVWTYEWNALNRLKAVTRPDGNVWQYFYDALARRVVKEGPQEAQQFLWDKDVVIQQTDGVQSQSAWIFDTYSFAPIATVQNARVYTAINDHLGTPKELIDSFGKVEWTISTKAWGSCDEASPSNTGPVSCCLRFQGQWFDSENELSYNRFRYYDAECGRYITEDPIALSGGLNLSRYAINPINWIDPLGLCDETVGDNDVTAMRERLQQGVPPDQVVPDHYAVVRGGQGDMPPPGQVFSGGVGATPTQAGAGVPHGSVRPTTAGEIRAQGGTVTYVPEPTRSGDMNYRHVNVVEGTDPSRPSAFPAQHSTNPAPKSSRVQ